MGAGFLQDTPLVDKQGMFVDTLSTPLSTPLARVPRGPEVVCVRVDTRERVWDGKKGGGRRKYRNDRGFPGKVFFVCTHVYKKRGPAPVGVLGCRQVCRQL